MVSQNHNVILEQYEQASAVNCGFKLRDPAEVLFLPPEFAQIVGALVGHKISIQNMDGQSWNVKISLVEGDLAFEEGWPAFVQGNNLRYGDILAFSNISESHFSVDISTQERTKVYKRYKKTPGMAPSQTSDDNTVDGLGSTAPLASGSKLQNSETSLVTSSSASVTNVEDPICMLYRAAVDLEKASSIETSLPHFHVEEKKEIHGEDSQPPLKHFKKVDDELDGLYINKCRSKPFDDEHPGKVMPDSDSKSSTGPKPFDSSPPKSTPILDSVEEAVYSDKELAESREQSFGSAHQLSHGNLSDMTTFGHSSSPIVKTEPDFSKDMVSSAGLFKVRVKSQAYLELPLCISSSSSSSHRGAKKIVSLKDSSGRYWPMIFHELRFVRGLSGMWSGFCEANGVEPGDICEFRLDKDVPCVYTVIVHKSGTTS